MENSKHTAMSLYRIQSDRALRQMLYQRQCVLLKLEPGRESVCLSGQLVRLNPKLLK